MGELLELGVEPIGLNVFHGLQSFAGVESRRFLRLSRQLTDACHLVGFFHVQFQQLNELRVDSGRCKYLGNSTIWAGVVLVGRNTVLKVGCLQSRAIWHHDEVQNGFSGRIVQPAHQFVDLFLNWVQIIGQTNRIKAPHRFCVEHFYERTPIKAPVLFKINLYRLAELQMVVKLPDFALVEVIVGGIFTLLVRIFVKKPFDVGRIAPSSHLSNRKILFQHHCTRNGTMVVLCRIDKVFPRGNPSNRLAHRVDVHHTDVIGSRVPEAHNRLGVSVLLIKPKVKEVLRCMHCIGSVKVSIDRGEEGANVGLRDTTGHRVNARLDQIDLGLGAIGALGRGDVCLRCGVDCPQGLSAHTVVHVAVHVADVFALSCRKLRVEVPYVFLNLC